MITFTKLCEKGEKDLSQQLSNNEIDYKLHVLYLKQFWEVLELQKVTQGSPLNLSNTLLI